MHKHNRTTWFILIILTIILGLLSRHIAGIPLFIGDVLWGTMVYFIFRFLFTNKSVRWITIVSLIFSYSIEFSQLYQADWINRIRHTVLGGLILGEVFLWSDMLCYTVGIGLAIITDCYTTHKSAKSPKSK